MERLRDDRSYYLVILLSLIPFGWIYGIWFQYDAIKALNLACGRKEGTDTSKQSPGIIAYVLFTGLTFGIYGLFWLHKQGRRMTEAGRKYGVCDEFVDADRKGFTWIIISLIIDILSILLFLIPYLGLFLGPIMLIISFIMMAVNMNKFFTDLNTLSRAYNKDIAEPHRETPSIPKVDHPRPANTPSLPGNGSGGYPTRPLAQGNNGQSPNSGFPSKSGVVMLTGQYAGSTINIKPGESITIGRDPARCALICESDRVSRVHVNIRNQSGTYYVTDMSTNGTVSSESGKLPKNQQVVQHAGTVLKLGQSNESIRLI